MPDGSVQTAAASTRSAFRFRASARGDGFLIGVAIAAAIALLALAWFGLRQARDRIVAHEAAQLGERWGRYLVVAVPDLPDKLNYLGLHSLDQTLIDGIIRSGGITRYKLFDRAGVAVFAARRADRGLYYADRPYFRDQVMQGRPHHLVKTDTAPDGNERTYGETYFPIVANGRFAFAVDKDTMPYKGVSITGPAEVVGDDVVDSIALVKELAVQYVGPEGGPAFGEYIAAIPGVHVTLVLHIENWESWDYSS